MRICSLVCSIDCEFPFERNVERLQYVNYWCVIFSPVEIYGNSLCKCNGRCCVCGCSWSRKICMKYATAIVQQYSYLMVCDLRCSAKNSMHFINYTIPFTRAPTSPSSSRRKKLAKNVLIYTNWSIWSRCCSWTLSSSIFLFRGNFVHVNLKISNANKRKHHHCHWARATSETNEAPIILSVVNCNSCAIGVAPICLFAYSLQASVCNLPIGQ